MARCCSQWPIVMLFGLGVVLFALQVASVFTPRYDSFEDHSIFTLTNFYLGDARAMCSYNGAMSFDRNCPSKYFGNSVTGVSLALSMGVIAFLIQIAVLTLYLIFLGSCCNSDRCDRGFLNAIHTLLCISCVFQIVEVAAPTLMRDEMQSYFSSHLDYSVGFVLNIMSLVVTVLMFIFTAIYRQTGARSNKCYDCCSCCYGDYEVVSGGPQVTSVTTIPAPATVTYYQQPPTSTYTTYPPVQQVAYTQTQSYPPQQVYYQTQHPEPSKVSYNVH